MAEDWDTIYNRPDDDYFLDYDIDNTDEPAKDVDEDDEQEPTYEPGDIDAGGDEDQEFVVGFKEMQQMGVVKGGRMETDGAEKQKMLRSPDEAAIDQIKGILNSDQFNSLSDDDRTKILSVLESFNNIHLQNLVMIIYAALWKISGLNIDKKNVTSFISRYGIKDQASFVRYIRLL